MRTWRPAGARGRVARVPRERGSVSGAAAGLVIVGLSLGIVLMPERPRAGLVDARRALHDLLVHGPGEGQWRLEAGSTRATWHVAPDPARTGCWRVAQATPDGAPLSAARWSTQRVARYFVPGPADLFFHHYESLGDPAPDTNGALRQGWAARGDHPSRAQRWIWIDPGTRRVVALEDRTRDGHPLRRLVRVGDASATLVAASDLVAGCTRATCASLESLAARTPFPFLAPLEIPDGFVLVEADYRTVSVPAAGAPADEGHEVRLAFLTWSDGLATLALGVAPPEDLDLLETCEAAHGAGRPPCPPASSERTGIARDGRTIRRHREPCRTVFRWDGPDGVSVALLARNELPEEIYLRVIGSVGPVARPAAGR